VTAAPDSLRPGLLRLYRGTPAAILESLTVMILAVVLVGIGVRYATAAGRSAEESAARSQIVLLAPAIQSYHLDHDTYRGMTAAELGVTSEDSKPAVTFSGLSDDGFCVQARVGDWYAAQNGASGQIQTAHQPLCP
jgi:type II secretory pathway pseudopilin PulG